MNSAYTRGANEAGTGSHQRRKDIIESHVRTQCPSMFHEAVAPVTQAVSGMAQEMKAMLTAHCLDQVETQLRVNYCSVWEEATPAALQARQVMQGRLRAAVTQAKGALNRLLQSQGLPPAMFRVSKAGDDDDDDEELVDVTEAVLREKRERAEKACINLCDDDDDDVNVDNGSGAMAADHPTPGSAGTSAHTLGKVKTEGNGALVKPEMCERDANHLR